MAASSSSSSLKTIKVEQADTIQELGKPESVWGRVVRRFLRHRLAVIGLVIFVLLGLAAILAGVISPYSPDKIDLLARNKAPSFQHFFGTDGVGRDIFARTIYGGRVSLAVGLVSVAISLAIGAVLGGVAGFVGGLTDSLIMRFTDVIMAFPSIVIILTVAAIFGSTGDDSVWKTMLLIGLLNWPIPCRLLRAEFLAIRAKEYITAARALGIPNTRIMLRHAFPNAFNVLIVYGSLGIANAILLEAGLSFLGLGVQAPTPSWGNMLNPARNVSILEQYPWQWLPAGAAIVLTVLAVNFIGDGLRDALDPRSKK